jgi:RNA-directed DNA polymerase
MDTPGKRRVRTQKSLGNWRLVRYADDFVLMVSGQRRHAEALQAEVANVLAPLGLRVAPEKTRVVHIDEGFDFLGFHIRRQRKRGTEKSVVYTTPSRKAVQTIKDKVKAKTNRSTLHMDVGELLASLNRTLRGWANYFRHGVSKAIFGSIDNHAWSRITRWIFRKHARLSWRQLRLRFCRPGSWRISHNGVGFTGASNVAVSRYRYRGSKIPTPWAPEPAGATVAA